MAKNRSENSNGPGIRKTPGGVSPRSPRTKHPSTSQDPGKPGGFVPNGSVNMVIVTLSRALFFLATLAVVVSSGQLESQLDDVYIVIPWLKKNNHSGPL